MAKSAQHTRISLQIQNSRCLVVLNWINYNNEYLDFEMATNKYKLGKSTACIRKSLCAKASLSVRDVFFLFYRQHQRFVLLLFTHQWTYSFHTVPSVSVLTIYHSYHTWDISLSFSQKFFSLHLIKRTFMASFVEKSFIYEYGVKYLKFNKILRVQYVYTVF